MILLFLHLYSLGCRVLVEVDQPMSSLPAVAVPEVMLLLQLMQQILTLVFQDQHSLGM